MSEILCQWLNQDLKLSRTVSPKAFAKAFSSGYLIGEVLHKFELQDDFSEFSESRISTARLNNFSRLEPTLHLLGVQFDQNVAHSIITEKPGAATKLLYQLYIALQKKKKSERTAVEMQSMQPLGCFRLQNMKSEAFREQRLSRRRQNEIMAKIQAAIIQIPKPTSNRTLKALEAQKMLKKKKEAEDVANEIKKFEALIKKDLQAKESASKTSLDTADHITTDLLNTYSDDDYIKKIQKRLEEDAFAREQREKRRRRLLMDQLIAREAQEALAKQAKIDFEEQILREKEFHAQIAMERAKASYKKHYEICAEILDQILDLSTKVADYRMLTNNLIPRKLMHDWKELFFNGKPLYEQASIKHLPARHPAGQLVELEKRDLLDNNDYEEYKNMVGEWALPEEMVDNLPPSNNCILGHVLHRLVEKSLPPQVEPKETELPSFAIKGCLLGKTLSGKSANLKSLQKDFPIQVLSIDKLVQEAIQAFYDNEEALEAPPIQEEDGEEAPPTPQKDSIENQDPQNVLSTDLVSGETVPETKDEAEPEKREIKRNQWSSVDPYDKEIRPSSMEKKKRVHELPIDQSWILDGFPMTLNQAQLLEETLTGCNRNLIEKETKKTQISTLAVDPTASKEVPPPPSAFDFVILLDISDAFSLSRKNDIMAEEFAHETTHKDIGQPRAAENQDKDVNQNLKDQIQHRITSFLDNWPLLEQWFSETENVLIKVNAEIDKESLYQKLKDILSTEIVKKRNKVEKKLEEKEAEKKAAAAQAEPPPPPPPPPPPEAEKEKEKEPLKTSPTKGKPQSETPRGKQEALREGKGKKGETAPKRKGTAEKGKSLGGKTPVKKSPADSTDISPTPTAPPLPKPGSEEWVYVNEPIPELPSPAATRHFRLGEIG
ncbi:Hypothetical predicted protein [Marmota monax]|uniref:Calponin-homology (CH) domain-containing protein n=1 Tax=Marmota monax TaxID=9995 RepID=A0A5E4AWN8_MARMO|nr:Hypothetical predicted protein [Marmota monax]